MREDIGLIKFPHTFFNTRRRHGPSDFFKYVLCYFFNYRVSVWLFFRDCRL